VAAEASATVSAAQARASETASANSATAAAQAETDGAFWAGQAESFAVAAEAAASIVAEATGLDLQTLIVSARRGSDYRTLGIELF
jgi:hypothetical protein